MSKLGRIVKVYKLTELGKKILKLGEEMDVSPEEFQIYISLKDKYEEFSKRISKL